jgi:hypothetical protein
MTKFSSTFIVESFGQSPDDIQNDCNYLSSQSHFKRIVSPSLTKILAFKLATEDRAKRKMSRKLTSSRIPERFPAN